MAPTFLFLFTRFPTTVQTQFREFDLFAAYKFSLGPVDVTLGNIAFIIDRGGPDFRNLGSHPAYLFLAPDRHHVPCQWVLSPRLQVSCSTESTFGLALRKFLTSRLQLFIIRPSTTREINRQAPRINIADAFGNQFNAPGPLGERNDELGGYLEGRINGNFACGHWLDINPYGVIAYSFRDRTEPIMASFGGRPFTGFTHAQAGLELAFHITPHIDFVPQVVYSYHISQPPIGTDRNEFWGGVKVAVNLW